jgi:hypothetical protein
MTENTNPITGREQVPAGVYAWHIKVSWTTRPCDVAGTRVAQSLIGQPSTIDVRGQLTLDAAVPFSVVAEQLWMAAHSSESIPDTATVTKFTLDPTGGGQ